MRQKWSGIAVLLSCIAFSVFAAKPNVDAFGASRGKNSSEAAVAARLGKLAKSGHRIQIESRLGVPTMLWTDSPAEMGIYGPVTRPNHGERPEVAAARAHLTHFAPAYGLDGRDIASAVVSHVHQAGNGPVIVKFRQQVGGIDIFREEMSVIMTKDLGAVAIGGYISSAATPGLRGGDMSFRRDRRTAAADAISDAIGSIAGSQLVSAGSRDGYELYSVNGASNVKLDELVRVKPVYFHHPDGLEAGYYVEVIGADADTDGDGLLLDTDEAPAYGYVISAFDGSILFRNNLIAHAEHRATVNATGTTYTYRVWADPNTLLPLDTPAGNAVHPKVNATPDGFQASFLGTSDVTLSNYPFSYNDPWLPADSTETVGNNVDAFVNLVNPDGYSPVMATPADPANGDYRAKTTGPNEFLSQHVAGAEPKLVGPRMGAVQQLFYNINFLHDWFYDSGFDEAAGNAQTSNYGRGGLENDSIKGQAQDVAGRNNANMLTPADGSRPRMRMYLFDTNAPKYGEVISPANIAGRRSIGTGTFGPQSFDLTSEVLQSAPHHGCTAFTNAAQVAGKIVMVSFQSAGSEPTCSIGTKLNNAMAAGASAFILVYLQSSPNTVVNVSGSLPSFTIPFTSFSWNGASAIKTELAVPNVVTLRLRRDPGLDRDGSLDNQIVAHEWGHYLSGRLVGNAAGLNTNYAGGMGEGWGDFVAMMLTVREDDTATPSNADWNGAYAIATYATSGGPDGGENHGYYWGIRRYPYSTDLTRNPLTFKHISNGVALPLGIPVSGGQDGANNSQVHNTGEVWASMLWECYAALLRDTQGSNARLTFQQAQERMKLYLVASLKMTPSSPTMLETRDAVLAAAYATDYTDYVLFHDAFAKRGAGIGAISPDRYSPDNVGAIESFVSGAEIVHTASSLDDSVTSCDTDGILDAGETGTLSFTLKNVGALALSGTTGTVTSATPGVSVVGSNVISFPPSDPTDEVAGTVTIALASGIAGAQQLDFHIEINDPQLASPRNVALSFRGNTDEITAVAATETAETRTLTPPWSIVSGAPFGAVGPWHRASATPMNFLWHGPNSGAASDESLVSPVFTVDGSGSVNVQFDHNWNFEFDGSTYYDGGVVEMSVNGGAWTDIGTPAYNGTIVNYTGNLNPLKTRAAFVGSSGGNVHTSLTQAIAPGSTVQVRFRIGTDNAAGFTGWNVDNIAFTGVIETPFGVVVADSGCAIPTATSLAVSPSSAAIGAPVTLTATVSSLGGTPSGLVSFFDGNVFLDMRPLVNGVATYETSFPSAGVHTLTARFDGGPGFLASPFSNLAHVTVTKAQPITEVTATSYYITPSRAITIVATVEGTFGTPAGSVTFWDGVTSLGARALANGSASMTFTSLTPGTHTFRATYAGNGTYAASDGEVDVVVAAAAAKLDLTADGKSDLVLQNSSTRQVNGWRMDGHTLVEGRVINTPANPYILEATGDVDGDGKADLILKNSSTNAIAVWGMNGLVLQWGFVVGTVTANDRVVGTYDYNHDGKADIVFQNTSTGEVFMWLMNGNTVVDDVAFGTSSNTALFTGSFGGDGVLFVNEATGEVSRWIVDATLAVVSDDVIGTLPAGTAVRAAGDFDRNGVDDVVYQDTTTAAVSIWRLTPAATILSNTLIVTPGSAANTVAGAADLDGDGRADIVTQHTDTRRIDLWRTNGTSLISGFAITTPVADWWTVVN